MERVVVRDGWRRIVLALLFLSCVVFATPPGFAAQSVSLGWDPSPDANVAGYNVYYGPASRSYTNLLVAGNATNLIISGLVEGATYYFAATAYDVTGTESDYSNEVSYSVPANPGGSNAPPTISGIGNRTLQTNSSTAVIAFVIGDPDTPVANLTLTAMSSYPQLIPVSNVVFGGSGANRTVQVTHSGNLSGAATIGIIVADGTGNSAAATFSLTVVAPAPPTLGAFANQVIQENSSTPAIPFVIGDPDTAVASLTLSAASDSPSLVPVSNIVFGGSGANRTVQVTPVSYGSGIATITAAVSDGINTASRTFTVTVSAVNQSPTLNSLGHVTLNENAGLQTVNLSGITSGAANESQTLTVTASSSNTGLIPNPSVTYTRPNTTGTLTFTPVSNASGTANITVTVNDGGTSNNMVTRTFNVTVNPVNQSPTLNSLTAVSLNSNAGLQTVSLSGITSGTPNENQTLTVTASSSNTGLIPNPTVTYSSPNTTGTLKFTPVASASGSATITVSVNDGGASNNIVTRTFPVTVNSPPTLTAIPNLTLYGGTNSSPIPFSVSDLETPAGSLTLSVLSSNQTLIPVTNIVFGGSGINRNLTLAPLTNQIGSSAITITVGDGSTTTSTTFTLVVQDPPAEKQIVITTNGYGTISPVLNAPSLTLGKLYTVTAKPAPGHLFTGWSWNGSNVWSATKVTFTAVSKLILQANFIPSPYLPASGSYSGLFNENAGVKLPSAGFFTASLTSGGAYSGKLQLAGKSTSFSGKMSLQCRATNIIKSGTNFLTLVLQAGSGNQAGQISGYVTDGNWISPLDGDRARFNAKTNPAPQAGSYTMMIHGEYGDPFLPAGHSFGFVKVTTGGTASLAGKLADGTKISQSVPLSQDGMWPLYVPLYSGKGLITSWQLFRTQAGTDFDGSLVWIKLTNSAARFYPAGFNYQRNVFGMTYTPPVGTNTVLNFSTAQVPFAGGDLPASFANYIQLKPGNKITNLSSNKLSMSFSLSTGIFTGTVTDPVMKKSWAFTGAVLQGDNVAYGFLTGTNESSQVALFPN